MFERLSNGWELTKESFGLLRMDKELLVFPMISGISCLLVLASFGVPLWFSGYGDVLREGGASVFLDQTAADALADKTLDVHAHGDHVHFTLDD